MILNKTAKGKRSKLAYKWEKFFNSRFALSKDNWDSYIKIHPFIRWWMKNLSMPVFGPMMRRMSEIDGKHNLSQGHIFPINRDLNYEGQNDSVVIPIDLVKKAIKESSYRVLKHKCFCRDGCGCKNYPIEQGCIMIGEGCRTMVARGTARPVTIEEALNHLETGAKHGLVCLTMWVGMEMVMLGIPEEDHGKIIEVCFCCPCCCQGLRFFKYYDKKFMSRWRSIGWGPVCNDDCTQCGICADACPMKAITIGKDGFSINEKCIGCGICAFNCPDKALSMREKVLMKNNLLDYFWGFRPKINS
jgi:NAD-dependent dihydropyrimidine dehydrogenase PreA subunit